MKITQKNKSMFMKYASKIVPPKDWNFFALAFNGFYFFMSKKKVDDCCERTLKLMKKEKVIEDYFLGSSPYRET